jgi:hypothetical protein
MKHILPILTLTTLAAAASAQSAAAPAGLSYNRVGVSREGQNNNLSVSHLLGSSNVLLGLSTRSNEVNGGYNNGGSGYTFLSVGYVFKSVASGIDATVYLGAGDQNYNSAVGVNLRRSLSEVYAGLEVALGYEKRQGSGSNVNESALSYELAYNINKQFQIAYGVVDQKNAAEKRNTVTLRYNF